MTEEDGAKIVGHKTFSDGKGGHWHEPLRKREADEILARCDAAEKKRAADMPTEKDAIRAMFDAWLRLKELGWSEAIYCPKDGTNFQVIEAGSTGIHECYYDGKWPDGRWWIASEGDLWPSRPILFKPFS
jgi:hypothetical protein